MSYYDPAIYNYEALNTEQKIIVDAFDIAVEAVENKEYIIDELMGLRKGSDILDSIRREIAGETIDAVLDYLECNRIELIVGLLES